MIISAAIPYLSPHLLQVQRTLARQSALHAHAASSSAAFMLFITISHIFSFPFSLTSCLTRVCVLFARTATRCHRKLKRKAKAESSVPFHREQRNKGTLWSSRVTLLSALILGLDQSEPPSPVLFSQVRQASSWPTAHGPWCPGSPWECRPGSGYSHAIILQKVSLHVI